MSFAQQPPMDPRAQAVEILRGIRFADNQNVITAIEMVQAALVEARQRWIEDAVALFTDSVEIVKLRDEITGLRARTRELLLLDDDAITRGSLTETPTRKAVMDAIRQLLPPRCPDCGATKCCYECATRGGNGSDLLPTNDPS